MHLEGAVSREFKEVMNPFYHKLSKYLVFLYHYRYHLESTDEQGKHFINNLNQYLEKD